MPITTRLTQDLCLRVPVVQGELRIAMTAIDDAN